ncbi:MAG: FadD3 family acyl-CoA ligase [Rhodospirillales bacterium]|jgi:acyl-CoA synthetase (AMP-forming)/AMP-acid ligase II
MLETGTWTLTTVPALCARAAAIYGDDPAIEDGDDTVSYAELDRRRRRVSRALVASGIGHGNRVMLWAPNSARWIEAALGIVGIGAVLIPVSTRFKGAEVEDLALRGGARLMFSAGTFLGTDHPALLTPATRATLREVVLLDPDDAGPDTGWNRFLARADGVPEAEVDARAAAVTPDTVSDILFTSGTTGRSKGVMYAHGQFLRVVRDWTERVGLRRGDRVLVIPPFFHAFGYRGGAVGSLIVGATVLPHGAYDAEAVLRRVEADRVSVIPGPPTIFQGMLGHPRMAEFDRSSLRLGITGGAVIPSVLVRRMREELGFRGVCNGYGLTECGGYGAMCQHDDPVDVIAETAGRPMPGIEIAMKDPQGRMLPSGEAGEVCIRGYIVMRGYLDDPEASARAIDADGWLHTGDIGRFDADGNLRIEDRLKDMYITGGFNCYPAEIERMLSDHPAINQVAVIGVPDGRLGEVGKAFVTLRAGAMLGEEELIAWARARMANYKVPRAVEVRAALPTSVQGKILKRNLR